MHSSTDSTAANPLHHPQLPVASTTTFHGSNHHIFLPQLQDHYLFPNTHMLLSANNTNVDKPLNNYVFPSSRPRAIGIKKDRHTKIVTAQGPRDRRVRLSICIARKFFDLQDTLGFDKPSKTLNWLFTKSKLAIEELFHATTDAKMAVKEDAGDSMAKDCPNEEEGTIGVITDLAKHSRAKARARARARTIKKMCIKELSEAKMLLAAEPSSLTEACKKPVPIIKPPIHKDKQVPTKESITPRICSVWDIPQHLMMPKGLGVGDNNGYSHNSQNWNNAGSTVMCSSLCAAMSGFSSSEGNIHHRNCLLHSIIQEWLANNA